MQALKAGALIAAALFASGAVGIGCAADNCYRALFPCPSPSAVSVASAFCATITAGGTTATNYPTRATNACGTGPSRYISACQCGPTCSYSSSTATSTSTSSACAATPTNGNLVYGDFECGTTPWALAINDPAFTISTTTPGFTRARTLRTAFNGPPTCGSSCTNGRITSPTFPLTPSQKYKLTFATFFDGSWHGFVGTKINGRGSKTVDSRDFEFAAWRFHHMPWTANATETSGSAIFEWISTESRLDTVTFSPVTAYCGNAPPVGILPDGEFECGLGAWTQQVPDPGATAGIADLSSAPDSYYTMGDKAWRVHSPTVPIPSQQEQGVSARIFSPPVSVTPGKKYLLYFTTWFSGTNFGFIGAMINGQAIYTRDPGDSTQSTPGWFAPNHVIWTAPAGTTTATIRIEAVINNVGTMMVDSVVFVEIN